MIPYLNVANQIQAAILRGEYPRNLPRINELCEIYQAGPTTIKRALRQLKEQEYIQGFRGRCTTVNPSARGNLYFRKNVAICAEMHKLGNVFYMSMLQDIGERFAEIGCRMCIVNSLHHLRDAAADASVVILIEPKEAELTEAGNICGVEKLLLLNSDIQEGHYVGSDNRAAGFMAMEYLHGKLGHRRIAIIGEECEIDQSFDLLRLEGARDYAAKFPELELFVFTMSKPDNVKTGVRSMLTEHPEITAFFLMRDFLALGVYNYCMEKHLNIPGQISVLGFDNRDFGAMLYPALSTFQEDGAEIARIAFDQALRMMRSEKTKRCCRSIRPMLLQRKSCARIK